MTCAATTRAGTRCRNQPLPGIDYCRVHASAPDPAVVEQLVAMLRSGAYLEVACAAAGIRPDGDLVERLEQARAEGEIRNIALIANAAREGSWAAAAWLLERQHPERWARSARIVEQQPPRPALPPPDALDELAATRERRRKVFA